MSKTVRREPNKKFVTRLHQEMAAHGIKPPTGDDDQHGARPLAAALTDYRRRNCDSADEHGEIHHTTVGRWIDGSGDPSGPYLGLLADFFDCTMDYLWGRVDERVGIYSQPPKAFRDAVGRLVRVVDDLEGLLGPGSGWDEDDAVVATDIEASVSEAGPSLSPEQKSDQHSAPAPEQ